MNECVDCLAEEKKQIDSEMNIVKANWVVFLVELCYPMRFTDAAWYNVDTSFDWGKRAKAITSRFIRRTFRFATVWSFIWITFYAISKQFITNQCITSEMLILNKVFILQPNIRPHLYIQNIFNLIYIWFLVFIDSTQIGINWWLCAFLCQYNCESLQICADWWYFGAGHWHWLSFFGEMKRNADI